MKELIEAKVDLRKIFSSNFFSEDPQLVTGSGLNILNFSGLSPDEEAVDSASASESSEETKIDWISKN